MQAQNVQQVYIQSVDSALLPVSDDAEGEKRGLPFCLLSGLLTIVLLARNGTLMPNMPTQQL